MSRKKGKSKPRGCSKSTAKRRPSSPPRAQQLASSALRPMASHPTAAFDAGKKLRHMPIRFVSAGCLQGTIEERPPAVKPASDSDSASASASIAASSSCSPPPDNTAAMAHMALRSPSPTLSDSSSSRDEVVFRGRGQEPLPRIAPADAPHAVARSIFAKPSTQADSAPTSDADDLIQHHFATRRDGRPAWEGTTTEWQHRSKPNVGWLPNRARPDLHAFLRGDVKPHDAAMADYMQNVQEFGLAADANATPGFALREMELDAGSYNDWDSASDSQGKQGVKFQQRGRADTPEVLTCAFDELDSWDSDRVHGLEAVDTSSDAMETVVRILAKRTRRSGLHYLCVYEGSVSEDAHWLPGSLLRSPAEKKLVGAFEEQVHRREQQQGSSIDSADADDDANEDEAYDDEVLARVLQTQEELGLGSDQALLYAGDEVFDTPFSFQFSSFGIHSKSKMQRQARGRGNREPSFPCASAMADALSMDPYGGFDIMDTERPSLRPKRKGRRGQMPPELDDADLHDQLQSAWATDRSKKRLRKAEREELRRQGLLGRKDKSGTVKANAMGGTSMEDVVEAIREFMTGDVQCLALPPMDAHRRATIHQAASFLHLKSRSRGDGPNRFTVLSKTARTRDYTDDEFAVAMRHKGFLQRLHGPLHGEAGMRKGGVLGQHGRHKPQTGYRDGETVGADAPALGPENKGHALLSKMGWSKGMGLGALDNKGILQPIAHTVKITKAGLQ